ncbi:unnamed protein product, partial [Prunus brigantina]
WTGPFGEIVVLPSICSVAAKKKLQKRLRPNVGPHQPGQEVLVQPKTSYSISCWRLRKTCMKLG